MAKRLQAGARTKYWPCAIVSNLHLNNEMEVKAGLNSIHMKFAENIQTNLLRVMKKWFALHPGREGNY